MSLGDSVRAAAATLHMTPDDITVVHARPVLVQQLTWRPTQFFNTARATPEPLAEMVLTFHAGRLARIAVTYDRERTEGLTSADLHGAFTAAYGPSMLMPTLIPIAVASPNQSEIIGRWGDGETLVFLWWDASPRRVQLTVSSLAADRLLQEAIADGVRLEASEAAGG